MSKGIMTKGMWFLLGIATGSTIEAVIALMVLHKHGLI